MSARPNPVAPLFDDVLCIGLPERGDRRAHAVREFEHVGITDWQWVDAYGPQSEAVRMAYDKGLVAQYPPCFRCGKDECCCENRQLVPEQVGCWLSHRQAWKCVQGESLTLICEDDIRFTDRLAAGIAFLRQNQALSSALESKQPVLVRLGRALCEAHHGREEFRLIDNPVMSNPCYAINVPMARKLIESAGEVTTTVDIYTHRHMAQGDDVASFTLQPPIAFELSWSTGEVRSDIRPKQVYLDRLRDQLESGNLDDDSRARILEEIMDEEARFKRFRELDGG